MRLLKSAERRMSTPNASQIAPPIEALSGRIECERFTINIPERGIVTMPRSGHVRLVKDKRRRAFAVEFYNKDADEPNFTYTVSDLHEEKKQPF